MNYSAVFAATHLICVNVWGQRSAFVLQLLNLTCVLGFMTSPLIVKPFLHTAAAAVDDVRNSSQDAANCSSHNFTVNSTASSCDVTPTSHDAVTHVFVIVAIYSLVVGLLMLAIFIKDYHAQRCHVQLRGVVMQMSTTTDTDDRLDDAASQCDYEVTTTTTTTHKVVTFRVKIALLFFVFNFFYGGIEVGYAGLVMTYVVTYFDWSKDDGRGWVVWDVWNKRVSGVQVWSKDDGTTLVFVLQASNALVTALSVGLSRYIQPQVISNSVCNYLIRHPALVTCNSNGRVYADYTAYESPRQWQIVTFSSVVFDIIFRRWAARLV